MPEHAGLSLFLAAASYQCWAHPERSTSYMLLVLAGLALPRPPPLGLRVLLVVAGLWSSELLVLAGLAAPLLGLRGALAGGDARARAHTGGRNLRSSAR